MTWRRAGTMEIAVVVAGQKIPAPPGRDPDSREARGQGPAGTGETQISARLSMLTRR